MPRAPVSKSAARRPSSLGSRSIGLAMLRLIPHPTVRLAAGLGLFVGPALFIALSDFGSNAQLLGIGALATLVSLFLPRSMGRPSSDD